MNTCAVSWSKVVTSKRGYAVLSVQRSSTATSGRGSVAYLKVGYNKYPASASEPEKMRVYPLLGVQNPQF